MHLKRAISDWTAILDLIEISNDNMVSGLQSIGIRLDIHESIRNIAEVLDLERETRRNLFSLPVTYNSSEEESA